VARRDQRRRSFSWKLSTTEVRRIPSLARSCPVHASGHCLSAQRLDSDKKRGDATPGPQRTEPPPAAPPAATAGGNRWCWRAAPSEDRSRSWPPSWSRADRRPRPRRRRRRQAPCVQPGRRQDKIADAGADLAISDWRYFERQAGGGAVRPSKPPRRQRSAKVRTPMTRTSKAGNPAVTSPHPPWTRLAAQTGDPGGCFEDEAGQTLRPPKARTWSRRGHTPLVRVSGKGSGRVCNGLADGFRQGRASRLDHFQRS
jgi:hypothetical protein